MCAVSWLHLGQDLPNALAFSGERPPERGRKGHHPLQSPVGAVPTIGSSPSRHFVALPGGLHDALGSTRDPGCIGQQAPDRRVLRSRFAGEMENPGDILVVGLRIDDGLNERNELAPNRDQSNLPVRKSRQGQVVPKDPLSGDKCVECRVPKSPVRCRLMAAEFPLAFVREEEPTAVDER